MSQRVLQITPSLEFDGTCRPMALLSQQLARRGFRVRVVSVGGPGPMAECLERSGIRVGWITPDVCRVAQQVAAVRRRLLNDFRPDLVHTWGRPADWCGRLAALTLHRPRAIATYQQPFDGQGLVERQLDRQLMRRTDAIVVDTQVLRDAMTQRSRHGSEIRIISPGFPPAAGVTAEQRTEVLAAWGIPPTARVIGVGGPLLPNQRIKDLIWAADLIKTIRDDVYLVIGGQGPHQWRLRRYRDQVRIADRVKLIGGRQDLSEQLGVFDLVWHAARDGRVPYTALQAMSAGVPVVAGDTAVNREFISSGQTGRLVAVGDRAAFARAALRVLDDNSLADRLAVAARRYVVDRHDVASMVEQYVEVYRGQRADAAA